MTRMESYYGHLVSKHLEFAPVRLERRQRCTLCHEMQYEGSEVTNLVLIGYTAKRNLRRRHEVDVLCPWCLSNTEAFSTSEGTDLGGALKQMLTWSAECGRRAAEKLQYLATLPLEG